MTNFQNVMQDPASFDKHYNTWIMALAEEETSTNLYI